MFKQISNVEKMKLEMIFYMMLRYLKLHVIYIILVISFWGRTAIASLSFVISEARGRP